MTRWERVRAIVEAALERDEAERGRFLDERCGDDAALRAEVEELLGHDSTDDSYLDSPPDADELGRALARTGAELPPGTRLGPWVVGAPIASGGMGTVYRAERADGSFEKTVAVKVIKAGMGSAEVLARFENERRVLAELEHPGIARLLDAGATADGRPYLVMEHVEGLPIEEHARRAGLDLRERIELFAAVCDAVHAAHQVLVVHRDLKPGNVLVTPDGSPKLLDFGIAKVLDPDEPRAAGGSPPTLGPSRVLTPEYASPEQLRRERVTTASDVYSLGVLLHELLVGRRPFDLAGATPSEVERTVCEREPTLPSSLARGRAARGLAGDLDTILLQALQKEPARRYASAAQLAEDLRRHLRGDPVLARPDTWTYRVSKLVRRNRALVGATVVVVVALAVGLAVSLSERDRATRANALAEERNASLRALARDLLFELDASLAQLEGTTATRELVVAKALEYLDALSAQAADDVELRREVVAALIKIGDVQGGGLAANLGRHEDALASYRRALSVAEELGDAEPLARGLRVLCLHRIGLVEMTLGSLDAAHATFQRALELGAFESPELDATRLLDALAHVQDALVLHAVQTGDHAGAVRRAEELEAMVDSLAPSVPEEIRFHWRVLAAQRAGWVLSLVGRDEEAEARLRSAVELARGRLAERPRKALLDRALALGLTQLARFLQPRGELEESAALLEESAAILRRARAADPDNVRAASDLVACLNTLSHVYPDLGEHEANVAVGLEFLELTAFLVDTDPENLEFRNERAGARLAVCRSQSIVGRHERALEEALLAREELRELAALSPADIGIRRNLAVVGAELGMLHQRWARDLEQPEARLAQHEQAKAAFEDGLEILLALQAEGRLAPSEERYVDRAWQEIEESDEAIAALLASGAGLRR